MVQRSETKFNFCFREIVNWLRFFYAVWHIKTMPLPVVMMMPMMTTMMMPMMMMVMMMMVMMAMPGA